MQRHTPDNHDPEHIDKLLKKPNSLGALIAKAQKLLFIEQVLKKAFAPELTQRFKVMNLHQETLVLQAESAAWAMHLRFLEQELLLQLQAEQSLKQLKHIQIKVRPNL